MGKAFDNLLQEGKILEENSEYQGRRAHKVWWPFMSAECYVDPETKLPMAIGDSELGYEEPPAGTWEITIPDGFVVVDKRPGAAPTTAPDWLIKEEEAGHRRGERFEDGTAALIRGDYAEAAKQFELALGYDSWATFWLGSAYYELGQYDLAAKYFTEMLNMMLQAFGGDVLPYCNYALGLAQAKAGDMEAATANFEACLPAMIQTLRIPSAGKMFEYADNPKIRCGQHKPSDQEIVVKMVNRLRIITGRSFGYDAALTNEQNETAIAAWEQWFKAEAQIKFSPDAELLPVPVAPDPEQADVDDSPIAAWMKSLGYGRKSNQEIASKYSGDWLDQIRNPGTLLRSGMALYDVGRYKEALSLFEQMEKRAGEDQLELAIALLWQGQMLDLLGTRDSAVSAYQKVLNLGISRETRIRHDQFGLAYSPSVYAAERISSPFVRVENLRED